VANFVSIMMCSWCIPIFELIIYPLFQNLDTENDGTNWSQLTSSRKYELVGLSCIVVEKPSTSGQVVSIDQLDMFLQYLSTGLTCQGRPQSVTCI